MEGMIENAWVGAQKIGGQWGWTDGNPWFEDIKWGTGNLSWPINKINTNTDQPLHPF